MNSYKEYQILTIKCKMQIRILKNKSVQEQINWINNNGKKLEYHVIKKLSAV
jgi:hypothetical protein